MMAITYEFEDDTIDAIFCYTIMLYFIIQNNRAISAWNNPSTGSSGVKDNILKAVV